MSKQTSIRIRKPYDPSEPVRVYFPNPSQAKQSFKDECDINKIMAKYQKTGLIEHTKNVQGSYGDFTGMDDYHASINQVMAAQQAFMALPSTIRARFENDPAQFLSFMDDEDNMTEAAELGLIPSKPERSDIEPKAKSPAEERSDDKQKSPPKEAKNPPEGA